MKRILLVIFLIAAPVFAQINRQTATASQNGSVTSVVDAGANDTYTGCPTIPATAYANGMVVPFSPNTNNTGAASLNLCSLGAKSIKTVDGSDPDTDALEADKWYFLTYDGTNFQITGGGASGTASVSGDGMVSNSSGTLTGRTLVSTDTSIDITNADGLAGNPVLEVNCTYVDCSADDAIVTGHRFYPKTSAQTIDAVGDTIAANGPAVSIDSNANYTLTSTPTIADGTNGQTLKVCNVDTAFTVTLQDEGTLASSNLQLSSTTVGIAPLQCLDLYFDGTYWAQSVSGSSGTTPTIDTTVSTGGPYWFSGAALTGYTAGVAFSSGVPRYYALHTGGAKVKFDNIAAIIQTSGGSGTTGMQLGIYDSSCNIITNGKSATVTGLNAVAPARLLFAWSNEITLEATTLYYIGMATDDTTVQLSAIGSSIATATGIILNGTTPNNRVFTGSNSSTSSGSGLTLPDSCGTRTNASTPFLNLVALPY
jgi:hypothetical protein